MSRWLKVSVVAGVAVGCLVAGVPARAQKQAPEADLKAAIISNMLLFVEWPAKGGPPNDQIVICYQDLSPVASALRELDGKLVKSKVLAVSPFDPGKVRDCDALYLSPGNVSSLPQIQSAIAASPVFLAGDSAEYLQRGVMLNLDIADGRVVFDIDLRSARRSGFQISSKALRLARRVFE